MLQEDMRRRLYVSAMQRGAAVYAVLLLPLGYVMPPYLAWENGVLEMLQNIVLFGDMCLAAYFSARRREWAENLFTGCGWRQPDIFYCFWGGSSAGDESFSRREWTATAQPLCP